MNSPCLVMGFFESTKLDCVCIKIGVVQEISPDIVY